MKTILITSILFLMGSTLIAQTTYPVNNPFANPVPLGYLGWNDTLISF